MSDKRIQLFTRTVKERLGDRLIRVVLFGSRARGDAQDDSGYDYDCLIVVREMNNEAKELVDEAAGAASLPCRWLRPKAALGKIILCQQC